MKKEIKQKPIFKLTPKQKALYKKIRQINKEQENNNLFSLFNI